MEVRSHSRRGGNGTRAKVAQLPHAHPLEATVYGIATRILRPVEALCVRGGLKADAVTIASLAAALAAGAAASMARIGWAGALYLASGALDLLDGRIARITGTASPRGAALDSIADRLAETLVLGGLAWGLHTQVGVSLCFALMGASMLVSYARARGEGLGVSVGSGLMARGPRVALLAFTMIVEGLLGTTGRQSTPFLFALALWTALTAWTALDRIVKVLRALPSAPGSRASSPPPPHIRPVA